MPPGSSPGQPEGMRLARRTKRTTRAAKPKDAETDVMATAPDTAEETGPGRDVEDATIISETAPGDDPTVAAASPEAEGTLGDDSVKTADAVEGDGGEDSVSDGPDGAAPAESETLDISADTVSPKDGTPETETAVTSDVSSADMGPTAEDTPADGSADDTIVADETTASAEVVGEEDLAKDDTSSQTAMVPPPQQIIEKSGPGFVPLVLGGVIAAVLGYLVATLTQPVPDGVDGDRIAALESDIAALQQVPAAEGTDVDLGPLQAVQAELADRVTALEAAMGERPPAETGAPATDASTAAVAEAPDLTDLRIALADLTATVDDLASDVAGLTGRVEAFDPDAVPALMARLDAVEATLADLEARADSNADDAEAVAREAARNQLALAVESGLPFAETIAQLPDAPEALEARAADGVPTTAELADEFPALARAALREARAAAPGDVGLGSLAGRFLNARSLEPREGDDPDAVLSRAEAAMRAGDVDTALAELDALPDEARAPLADWIARAEARAAAQAALNEYLQDG